MFFTTVVAAIDEGPFACRDTDRISPPSTIAEYDTSVTPWNL